MNTESFVTLQDLQVLNEKATQGEWLVDRIEDRLGERLIPGSDRVSLMGADLEFIAALVNYYRSGALQRLAQLAEDGLKWRTRSPLRVAEACSKHQGLVMMFQASSVAYPLPRYCPHCEADSARAPSVKEQKRG